MQKRAEESHREILKPLSGNVITVAHVQQPTNNEINIDEAIPYYHEFSDTKLSQEIRSK